MWIKLTRAVAILVLALALQGCETEVTGVDMLLAVFGDVEPVVPKDTDVVVGTLFRHVQTNIPPGQATVSGKVAFDVMRPAFGQATLLTQMRFTVQHKNSKNKLLATFSFDVTVDADGKIPAQKFPFPGLVMNPNDSLLVSLTPLDADLPKDKLKLKLKYKASV